MRINQHIALLLLTLLFLTTPGCAGGSMSLTPWPSQVSSGDSVVVQFMHLEFRLPRSMVGRIIVHDVSWLNLTIVREPDNPNDILLFGVKQDFWNIYEVLKKKGFFEGLDIHDAEGFFDSLAASPSKPELENLKFMREAFSVEGTEYTKSVKGEFTVYRAASHKHPVASTIYILIDGDKTVYQLSGDISDADYAALLSGLARASVR